MELWKEVKGYEGLYWVSNLGNIKSAKQLLKPMINRSGYSVVSLCCKGTNKKTAIHSLVAKAFLENPENKPEVNHKDENKQNNNSYNLEWCTRSYNMNYGTINERKILKLGKPIIQIDLITGKIIYWKSCRQAGVSLNKDTKNIRECLKNNFKQAYGSRWIYG